MAGCQISLQTSEHCFTLLTPTKVSSILLNGLEEGLAFIDRPAEEPVEVSVAFVKYLDFLITSRGLISNMIDILLASALISR